VFSSCSVSFRRHGIGAGFLRLRGKFNHGRWRVERQGHANTDCNSHRHAGSYRYSGTDCNAHTGSDRDADCRAVFQHILPTSGGLPCQQQQREFA
jgi:hypothetical protein